MDLDRNLRVGEDLEQAGLSNVVCAGGDQTYGAVRRWNSSREPRNSAVARRTQSVSEPIEHGYSQLGK